MREPTDDQLLAFLEGTMEERDRTELLDALDSYPELRARLRSAVLGLEAIGTLAPAETPDTRERRKATVTISPWWVATAAVAALVIAVPTTWWLVGRFHDIASPPVVATGRPEAPEPSFVLVLQGVWTDADSIEPPDVQARAREYWDWTSSLATGGVLVAAGDLRWEPGERLGPEGAIVRVETGEVQRNEFVVGMLALRVGSYEEALAIARECPHLKYGGFVSVRRVGGGFVTVAGMGDWSD